VPAGFAGADLVEVRAVRVGVPDGQDVAVGPGGQRVGGDPQVLRDAAGFVEDDQQMFGMDALESGLSMVGWFPTVGNQLVVDLPLGGLRDTAWEAVAMPHLSDIPPEDRPHLSSRRRGGDHEGAVPRAGVEEPAHQPRGEMGLADAVARLDGDEGVVGDGLHDLGLPRPGVLAKTLFDPSDRVVSPVVDLAVQVEPVGQGEREVHC
jgi:hypothetical protein